MTQIEYFTPQWQRPHRKNDIIPSFVKESSASSSSLETTPPFWHQYPCLICGKTKDNNTTSTNNYDKPKRCSRCKSTVYCSSQCQKHDYGEGKHKSHCLALHKLWEEKARLEHCLWYGERNENATSGSTTTTNPFDDDYIDPNEEANERKEYAIVGKFWCDAPSSTLQRYTNQYCVVLLQLVQLLGRAESWRVSRIVNGQEQETSKNTSWRNAPLNPLSSELAIDIAFTLYHLDRTDRRVRLLIRSLLLEGMYYQEAYNFLKFWTRPEGCLSILDLALPGGNNEDETDSSTYTEMGDQDMMESPIQWMDGEIVYPSVGMVFELAYLKCHFLMLKSKQDLSDQSLVKRMECLDNVSEGELKQQVHLLLSLVHKWNPHLLPKLGQEIYNIHLGALSSSNETDSLNNPRLPPALDSLLNLHPPGFELQYSFGNPGGGSIDEAASIWQRDMILWHVMNPLTMGYLSQFCRILEANLVDPSAFVGNDEVAAKGDTTKSCRKDELENAVAQRKEAEALVARLQREKPDRTIDQIMMHPDMAALMIKHLHTE